MANCCPKQNNITCIKTVTYHISTDVNVITTIAAQMATGPNMLNGVLSPSAT